MSQIKNRLLTQSRNENHLRRFVALQKANDLCKCLLFGGGGGLGRVYFYTSAPEITTRDSRSSFFTIGKPVFSSCLITSVHM